ncbi:MAG TPA: HEAT repeat domain-containing protein [Gemmataceae bacterium]|nr:HEAT repeat domain-containing protein [Gemmataceae bacterium]
MRDQRRTVARGEKFLLPALLTLGMLALSPVLPTRQRASGQTPDVFGQVRPTITFVIDPKTPVKYLLPTPPRVSRQARPLLATALSQVPEVHFQEPLTLPELPANYDSLSDKEKIEAIVENLAAKEKPPEEIAHQIAKINFLNGKKTDHFMELLLERRPDLAGLPFVMGVDCRLSKERLESFHIAVVHFRQTFGGDPPASQRKASELAMARKMWEDLYPPSRPSPPKEKEKHGAGLAALVQLLPVEAAELRAGFVPYLAAHTDKGATDALTRLALFDADESVRKAAVAALAKRPAADVNGILLEGLRYPWPEVAANAAAALTQLKRTDQVAQLVEMLDQPDPRAPVQCEVKGKKVPVVRELVRINHHRNCLLCHAPGNTPDVTAEILRGDIPIPGESFSQGGYGGSLANNVVRVDVTYLRQDFSRLQKVADAAPWPTMQRFDFLVRTRVLTAAEATTYRAEFARLEKTSPYRQAVLAALRSLTGRDAEPTTAAWRQALALSASDER